MKSYTVITLSILVEFTEGGDFFHAWRTTFPYIVHLHGSRYTVLAHSGRTTNRADWYHRKLELAFIHRASFIVSPSQALLDIVGLEAGGLSVPTQVIPYPIDPRLLQPLGSRPNGRTKKVLFAARNDPVKGGKVLLAAVPLVRQQIPDVEFHFFGFEPKLDQSIPEGVTLHPFVSKDELLAWYHTANICVIPSLWDNSPNTVYEAMIAGKPVVASRVGGIPELVIHEETGLLVPPSDPDSLATAIIRILSDKSEQLDMGVKGRERIQQLAALQPNVDQRLRLYNRIVRNAYV
ncbi:MAG: glycosyltransferase family 4 protein [Chitinophagaceae bacterium]